VRIHPQQPEALASAGERPIVGYSVRRVTSAKRPRRQIDTNHGCVWSRRTAKEEQRPAVVGANLEYRPGAQGAHARKQLADFGGFLQGAKNAAQARRFQKSKQRVHILNDARATYGTVSRNATHKPGKTMPQRAA
jgi:hypothetical protein